MNKLKRFLIVMVTVIVSTVSLSAIPAAAEESAGTGIVTVDETIEVAVFKRLQRYLNDNARYDEVNSQTLAEGGLFRILEENPDLLNTALSGMLESIDEYSAYFTEEEF